MSSTATDTRAKIEFTLPEGGIFSLVDHEEIAEQIREEETKRRETLRKIAEAREIAIELTDQISGIRHWLIAGDPKFVKTFLDNPGNPAMKAHCIATRGLIAHLKDGRVKKCDGSFYIGQFKKPEYVIPCRLSAIASLLKLLNPRTYGEGQKLRALTLKEIVNIALDIGALIKVNLSCLVIDKQAFSVAEELTKEECDEFDELVKKILTTIKKVAEQQPKPQFRDQATVDTIEEALEKGGVYLAHIPDQQDEEKTFFGGKILLCFDVKRRIISVDCNPPAEGHNLFCQAVDRIKRKGEITFDDVRALLEENSERLIGKREKPDYSLWCYVRSHINWLRECKKEEREIISKMRKDDDLTSQEFAEGSPGNTVLELKGFKINNKEASPAVIRVSRILVEGKMALMVTEANPSMIPFVSGFIGKGKVFPENNLPKVLAKFVKCWEQEQLGKTVYA